MEKFLNYCTYKLFNEPPSPKLCFRGQDRCSFYTTMPGGVVRAAAVTNFLKEIRCQKFIYNTTS